MAEQIAVSIAKAAFNKDMERAEKSYRKACDRFVRKVFQPLIAASKRLPEEFTKGVSVLTIYDTPIGVVQAKAKDGEEFFVPAGYYWKRNLFEVGFSPRMGDMREWPPVAEAWHKLIALHKAHRDLQTDVRNAAISARTVEKLMEAWPDAEEQLKPFLVKVDPLIPDNAPLSKLIERNMPAALPAPAPVKEVALADDGMTIEA